MFYEAARKEKITPEIAAKSVFGEYLNGCVSAVFSGVGKENVLCVSGLEFYVPIAEKVAVIFEKDRGLRERMQNGSLLVKINSETEKCEVICKGEADAERVILPTDIQRSVTELVSGANKWGGRINGRGELVCDLKSPSPGPNYYTNMLLGNRIGYGNVLQCTPKSVVDRLGRGSFRSHADTQVLATRWDYLPYENGFPANRQFYIIENGEIIFYSADPSSDRITDAECIHSQNRTVIKYTLSCGLEIKRTIFLLPQKKGMPMAAEAQKIEIANRSKSDRSIKVVYTGMLSNGSTVCLKEDIIYMTVIEESETVFDGDGNLAAVCYHYNPEYEQSDLRFHTSVAHIGEETVYPTEFCFDYNAFVGNGTLEKPEGALKLNCRHVRKGPAFFAVGTPLDIPAGESAEIDNLTCLTSEKDHLDDYKGAETMLDEINAVNEFLKDKNSLSNALNEVKEFAEKYTEFLKIKDGDKDFETYVNRNLPYQVYYQNFVSRSFDQTQKGYREIGFREIQDIYASMYYWIGMDRADIVKDFISQWASNVYKMGYANHNFFWTGKEAGVSSDDQLWLLQALDRYVSLTGDYDFIKQSVPMADGGERPLYETVKAIIEYSAKISVGKHGLPLIDTADWNDCLRVDPDCIDGKEKEKRYSEQIKNGGKWGDPFVSNGSESVMNGFLLKVATDAAKNLFDGCGMKADAEEMSRLSGELYDKLQKHTWKGDFFCRVLFNRPEKTELSYLGAGGDGLSANSSKPGTYYINSFAWSVLSGVASEEQIEIMLDSLEKYVKTPHGFQLSSEVRYDKIASNVSASNFFFGDRENGGIFKHANMMLAASMVKAANEVKSGQLSKRLCDTAYWLIEKIVPYACMKSPFTICGNPRFCTQYNNADTGENIGPTLSGTSSWLLLTVTMLLGFNTSGGKIRFMPLLKESDFKRELQVCLSGTHYLITVTKPQGFVRVKDGNCTFTVDGKPYESGVLPLFNDKKQHKVEMIFN